ncbi:RNA polymerase sigma factor [Corynebacterium uterequi]|uniref:RNA polymerase sigma factor, sigma-70 family n=1 Tax=Corynebacterium uterequi TaxID=1072256 RepID=A0A0G3HGD0_9CORY|nr:RNA polymerase sigma factor [Corynebacterium uterequi]AKK10172.1 RNA polymerase sigma factor, sigma-70 family [Corynebacterium uterequi]
MSTSSPHQHDRVTELALRAGKGDKRALDEFIRATHDDVWRLLAHLAGPELADDLTQDTYLRVLGALPRFAARSSARTWLLSLARRAWVDNIRRERSRPRASTVTYEDATAATPDLGADQSQWSEWIDARSLIDQLPAERREALILTQVLGYSYEEAATITGVRIGTIRSRVARARRDLIATTKS